MSDLLPMFGTRRVHVLHVSHVSIHGDIYFDLAILVEAADGSVPDSPQQVRIPSHLCPRPPIQGDVLRLTFLMQQVSDLAMEA